MSILTLARYLAGSRAAILQIAGNRHALWIGLLFVLSAGFAREYDGEDLLHEPWHVVIPVAASLGSSFILFLASFVLAAVKRRVSLRQFFPCYLSFLGLFWMTAPLAWLYAVPYEHFLSPADAVRANLWSLAVVSVWRVALMVRVLAVLFRYAHLQAFVIVLGFSTFVALVVIVSFPVPLVGVMSGSRLSSERDQVMADVAQVVVGLGCYVVLLGPALAIPVLTKSAPCWQLTPVGTARPGSLPWLAFASLAVWPFVLPHTQPAQQRRREVEKLYTAGHVSEALETMSRRPQSDYPPGWDPPPRVMRFVYPWDQDKVLELLEVLAEPQQAAWVRESYLDRLVHTLANNTPYIEEGRRRRLADLLLKIPEGRAVIERAWPRAASGNAVEILTSLRQLMGNDER